MIDIGSFESRDCSVGVSRRAFVRASAALPFLSAPFVGAGVTRGAEPKPSDVAASSSGVRTAPRAKSVIMVWLWGGPSHLDTFDPK
ncbi:MAG: hypothetical protein AAF517_16045, partial [Planctomycetota bacterium]